MQMYGDYRLEKPPAAALKLLGGSSNLVSM